MTREQHPGDRRRGVDAAPDGVDHVVVQEAGIAAAEHRVQVDRRAELGRRLPERIEVGIVEIAVPSLGLGADHGARKAGRDRLAQHLGGELARLQRHRRQGRETAIAVARAEQMLVEEPAPRRALVRRHLVAEAVEPAAANLDVDAVLAHPGMARLGVAQFRADRPGRRATGEGELVGVALVHQLDVGKLAGPGDQRVQHGLRRVVGVGVDDHSLGSVCRCAWIAASMSLTRSGSSSIAMPSG